MALIRKLLAPVASVSASIVLLLAGGPPDLAGVVAAAVGQLVGGLATTERRRDDIIADEANRANRAGAYEAYGAATALAWQAAGVLVTFKPRLVGYVHGLALLMRAQRRFEDQVAAATAALSDVLLYGSSETQEAALVMARTLAEKLGEIVRNGKQGSLAGQKAYAAASLDLGEKVVAWRKAAQADLGGPSDHRHG